MIKEESVKKSVSSDAIHEFEELRKEISVLKVMIYWLSSFKELRLEEKLMIAYTNQFIRVEDCLEKFKTKASIYRGEADEQQKN